MSDRVRPMTYQPVEPQRSAAVVHVAQNSPTRRIKPTAAGLADAMALAESPTFGIRPGGARAVVLSSHDTRRNGLDLLGADSHRISACDEVARLPHVWASVSQHLTADDAIHLHRAMQLPETRPASNAACRQRIATMLNAAPDDVVQATAQQNLRPVLEQLETQLARTANARPLLRPAPQAALDAIQLQLHPNMQVRLDAVAAEIANYHTDVLLRNQALLRSVTRTAGIITAQSLIKYFFRHQFHVGGYATDGWQFDVVLRSYRQDRPDAWYRLPSIYVSTGHGGMYVRPTSPQDMLRNDCAIVSFLSSLGIILTEVVDPRYCEAEQQMVLSEDALLRLEIPLQNMPWRLAEGLDRLGGAVFTRLLGRRD
jgi:hypothetical protein